MIRGIFSQCVYDVDNRYVDMSIRTALPITDDGPFILILSDRSNIEETDSEIELYLTRDDLKLVIDRLTEVLEK